MVCLFGGLVFFAPVALLVRTQAGVSESEFFLLQALLSCITALGEVPFGHITDKIGYKNSLILYQALLLIARALLFAAFLSRISVRHKQILCVSIRRLLKIRAQ